MKDGHFDPEAIWNCADNMSRRWQQLMSKSEERRKVVTASYSFFKSAEQVTTTVTAALHEPGLNTDPGQSAGVSRRVTRQGGLSRLDNCFHASAYKHLTVKGSPAVVIQPGLKSNPCSCKEALIQLVISCCVGTVDHFTAVR